MSTSLVRALVVAAVISSCALGFALGSVAPSQSSSTAKLSPQHQNLKALAGAWDADVKIPADAGGEPMTMKGTMTGTLICDGMWLVEEFKSDSFQGHGLTGYDAQKKKYVSVWVDSESPSLQLGEGTSSADGKTLTLLVESSDSSGKVVKTREVTEIKGDGNRAFTVYETGADGKEKVALSIAYTRRAAR
jgi:hypothetical protein